MPQRTTDEYRNLDETLTYLTPTILALTTYLILTINPQQSDPVGVAFHRAASNTTIAAPAQELPQASSAPTD